ncbi:PQQ-like beta-propeller repeat protein [candidate division WOR-3 bacterium]|nr:PQQ-like beta-propeller repeat protein [candidate division WOR-3 bacterium]
MPRTRSALILLSFVLLAVVASCRNHPPQIAQPPDGPTNCYPNKSYTYSATASDPNGDDVAVRFDWADSTVSDWTDWSHSGLLVTGAHAWAETGAYLVRAQAQDKKLLSSDWSEALTVQVFPRPETPAVPSGPTLCFKDTSYTYKSVTTDRYGDSVSIRFDWGRDTSDWSPFVASGETVAMSYAFPLTQHYQVTAQARDPHLHLTDWSEALIVDVIERRAPNTPATPSGPYRGGADSTYTFTTWAAHPQHLQVAIRFDWGDGDTSDWSAWVDESTTVVDSHAWNVADTWFVKAQAKDTGDAMSGWSAGRTIIVRPADTMMIWRLQIKDGAPEDNYSSPAIASDGTIYVGSQDDYLYAVNYDGSLKWRFNTGGVVRSSPAIGADGTIYVGSYSNSLYALNPADGSVKWSFLTHGNITSSPAIAADGTIIFGSDDDTVYALNPDSTVKWKFEAGQGVSSSPAIGTDGTIYFGSNDDSLYALTADGGHKWTFPTGRDIVGSPAIGPDGTVYFGSLDQYLYAVDTSGSKKWDVLTNGQIRTSPAIGPDGTIYIGSSDNLLYAVNPDGSTKWRYVTSDDVKSSPTIAANGTIYFGSDDDNLYAVGPDSTLVFKYPTDNDISSSPAIGADGKVHFVGNDGYLYQLKGTSPLANTSWPKFRHDIKNNGRVGAK